MAGRTGTASRQIRVGIIGASGYTGAETLRLLANHPDVQIAVLTADRKAGRSLAEVFPHLAGMALPDLLRLEDAPLGDLDAVFCCLPHGTTQEVVRELPDTLKVIDLSADFRLRDLETYAQWYGHAHRAPELQGDAVYGLTEIFRDQIAGARLVAVPGCYPTTAQLPLIPLLEAGAIDPQNIVIDAKSGVSGAGRAAKEGSLHSEVSEGFSAYGIASHRHGPEIDQGLSLAAGTPVVATFTPHLVPMNRGILATLYVHLTDGVSVSDARRVLSERYQGELFVTVMADGQVPSTRHVRGSNQCRMAVFADRTPGRAIIVSVLDNLVKGASGQAIQDFNVMFGLDETLGLAQQPLFP